MEWLSFVIVDWDLWERGSRKLRVSAALEVEAEWVCGPGDLRGSKAWERVWHRSARMIGE